MAATFRLDGQEFIALSPASLSVRAGRFQLLDVELAHLEHRFTEETSMATEALTSPPDAPSTPKSWLWAGRAVTTLFVLFVVFDMAIKLIKLKIVDDARKSSTSMSACRRSDRPLDNHKERAMIAPANSAATSDRELVLTRLIDAPRAKLFRAWTDPALLKQWFAPLPYTTPVAELDVRPGGTNLIVMRDPQGNELPNRGVYLEVVANERLVFTDAYTEAWQPSEKPFMTVILTFADEGGKTRYTARVRHWTVADREAHEKMGFHQGWGQCADQLAALVAKP